MKKLVFGAIFLCLASLGYSQSSDCGKNAVQLTGTGVGPTNQNYLDQVGGNISEVVYTMEGEAASHKSEKSPWYDDDPIFADPNNKTYDVEFEKRKDEVLVTYDRSGNIISSSEKYQDLTPPPAVRNSVFKLYPDWHLNKTDYMVYYNGKDAKKMYKVQLSKGKVKRNLKFDIDGNKIN